MTHSMYFDWWFVTVVFLLGSIVTVFMARFDWVNGNKKEAVWGMIWFPFMVYAVINRCFDYFSL